MAAKLVVTNRKRLRSKYGAAGYGRIRDRLAALAAADEARGIETEVVSMDIQSDVGPRSAPKIRDPGDPRQTKACVDALCAHVRPDYLMILGAPDVVCHQPLMNPIVGDEDEDVPSDLPYACDAGFSDEIADFAGPVRVVGRLPDEAGAADPVGLLQALDTAIGYTRRTAAAYKSYCAMSADAWKKSTQQSLLRIFGRSTVQHLAPPAGPPWSRLELKPRIHLINCHGLDFDTAFYGDDGNGSEPLVIDQADYAGRLRDGAVVAAECCYGAMLYDGSLFRIPRGICNTMLRNGCYGFLGSTNVAYGPADSNAYADLLCRYFIQSVRNGASTGRALLEARQRYLAAAAPLDPVDLKTVAQFCLLGDPSVHPVKMPARRRRATSRSAAPASTEARRKRLQRKGRRLGAGIAHVNSKTDRRSGVKWRPAVMEGIAATRYRPAGPLLSFTVQPARRPPRGRLAKGGSGAAGDRRFHVMGAYDPSRQAGQGPEDGEKARGKRGPDVLLVALEEDGAIRTVNKIYRR